MIPIEQHLAGGRARPHRIELRARPSHFHAYGGRAVLITGLDGWVTGGGLSGFYVENTRILSALNLVANGSRLGSFACSPVGGDAMLLYAQLPQTLTTAERGSYATVAHHVDNGLCTRVTLENFALGEPDAYELIIELGADFADMEEVESKNRRQTAAIEQTWDAETSELCLRYTHEKLDRGVSIQVNGAPGPIRYEDHGEGRACLGLTVHLPSHLAVSFDLITTPLFGGQSLKGPPCRFGSVDTSLAALRADLWKGIPRLTTTNSTVERAWFTATRDLASMPLGLSSGPAAPIAGLPRYVQLFGRDTLTSSWQASLALPTMLRDTLTVNAAWQGTKTDDFYDEQPGKMIHQARLGPLSVLGKDPYLHYYGDYTTPQDFLAMLGQYYLWSNDLAVARKLLPAARKALTWLRCLGDLDGDGFLEYVTRSPMGLKNQGWKDSYDAIVDPDGKIVPNPIATCEIQAYWYAALQQMAWVFLACGHLVEALRLRRQAAALKRRFNDVFWMEDEGYYALGLDPNKKQIRTIASNPSQCLVTGICPPDRARRVARRLLEPDLFSGWGIRTLSSRHPSYNPFSYHLGSVWPVSSGTFAIGLARYGCWNELGRVAEGLFAASELFVGNRLPEVLGGMPRDVEHPHPGMYPQSDEPQAWSDSAVVITIQALLGMLPVAPLGLLLVDPHLPPWLPDLQLEGIRVGAGRADLRFSRGRSGHTRYRVLGQEGLRVLRQPTPNSPRATLGGRVRDALASLLGV